jgi:hypothetical protein
VRDELVNEFGKLDLSTETIRELTADDLEQVAGGAAPPTLECFTGIYPTFDGCADTLLCRG